MAKLISPQVYISKKAELEYPVRVFAYVGIQNGAQIGRYTYINRNSFISGNARIGRFCSISRAVEIGALENPTNMLSNHPFQYSKQHFEDVPSYTSFTRDYTLDSVRTHIGHDVSIGAKGIIKGGVSVGIGAVVRANSYVDEDVRPYAIVAGSPAQVVGYRFPREIIAQLLASDWWELTPEEMQGMSFDDIEVVLEQVSVAVAAKRADELQAAVVDNADALDDPVVIGLKQSLIEMDIPDTVIDLVIGEAAAIAGTFDPLDTGDQEILQNKLSYLMGFVSERDTQQLSVNECKHIASLFRQRH